MEIIPIVVGLIQTNCYLVMAEDHTAALIDPGTDADRILRVIKEQGAKVEKILLTHGHFDHVCAVNEIKAQTGAEVYLHPKDDPMVAHPMSSTGFKAPGYRDDPVCVEHSVQQGDRISVSDLTFEVIHTPGHTPGCVVYRCQDALFTGDTLFAGSVGRTDLAGGDYGTLMQSLKKLTEISEDIAVYPGHGEASTLTREKQTNPYLGSNAYDSFD